MEIGPLHNHRPPAQADQPVTERKAKATPKAPPGDSVELSSEARRSLAAMADAARANYGLGAMPQRDEADIGGDFITDKLSLARQRIESGYYDQPHIRNEIARRLADEVNWISPTESD